MDCNASQGGVGLLSNGAISINIHQLQANKMSKSTVFNGITCWYPYTHLCHFPDLLLLLPTDIDTSGNINYTMRGLLPFHKHVEFKLNRPGTLVKIPARAAIACSEVQQCDITWDVTLENNQCRCAFNISCCANCVTFSFWWSWDMLNVPKCRYFLDVGGIYTFYNTRNSHQSLVYRVN